MAENKFVEKQLTHKTIRAFKEKELSQTQLTTLLEVARHTSTSLFMQQFSVLHITDPEKRAAIRSISSQKYVGANGDLFIFIADLYRNQQIRRQLGNDDGRLHTTDIFLQAYEDTVLAVQNVLNAAESMGLGGVILGSINDDPQKLIKVLNLPKLTYPVLGLQIGVPDQTPQLKPRLPLELMAFGNEYDTDFNLDDLKNYDEIVQTYYDLRDANRRIDSFSKQVNGNKLNKKNTKRDEQVLALKKQGLCLDF
ncbi:NADPH-dependent oxidoreductase [Ligilactobacillus sp. WILCCON 0076]|uniref:NADPH-dependent oxidoreductase n=1 Tax=Ligilactobacillus ubinensis TaxID=2876789 RepID=A0A9X2JMR5_9LACO|nr:NADPH-dependent oxidoreductase [Ligilactobacillus ubinensis]MCP0887805.1 NADPH-dependent oxidoreductase [Ligilactobacillus ubinensis]